jgi:two-component system, NarL family, nitrate/nitrite response regulator NarL
MNNMETFARVDETRSNGRHKRIRVLIADDHPVVRTGLREIFESEPDLEVVGEATGSREVVEKVRELSPDVVILDLRMPDMDGLAAMRSLQEAGNKTKILVLTGSEDKDEYVQAMRLGCCGIVLKKSAPDLIVKSIRKVHQGEIWLDSHTTAAVMRHFASPAETGAQDGRGRERAPLSNREREIVGLVAQGHKNKEMAEKLFISEQTVKNHLHNIFGKLGVSDRLELALYAIHNNGIYFTAQQKDPRSK